MRDQPQVQSVDPSRVIRFLIANSMLIGIIALLIIFGIGNPVFLSIPNLSNILLQSTGLLIIAVTSGLLVITGEVDLSVGSIMALAAVLAGTLMVKMGLPMVPSTAAGLAAGTLVGVANGLLVTKARINSIVVTLGMSNVARGVTFLIAVSPVFNFPESFLVIGNAKLLGLSLPVWIAASVFLIGWAFLVSTPSGRHLYAIGMNREAAYLAGLPVDRIRLLLFAANGFAAALAGIVLASRLNSAPPGTLGLGVELNVLTAVLLGGIAFTGGRGRLIGVLFAVIFLAMLQAGLTIMNVANAWQLISQGIALIAAVALDHLNHSKGRRAILPWTAIKTPGTSTPAKERRRS